MPANDPTPLPRPAQHADGEEDGFKERPTAQPLIPVEESVLSRLLQIQSDLAALCEKQRALALATKQIEASVERAISDLAEVRGEALPAAPATVARDHFKSAKTSVFVKAPIQETEFGAELPPIEIPGDGDWARWQIAWGAARMRASALGLPQLPGCPAMRATLDSVVGANLAQNTDAELQEFIERFRHYLSEYEAGLSNSKLYTACQSLQAALHEALHVDSKTDAQIERAGQALAAWEEKTNAQHRWFAHEIFDGELTESLTVAYDCLASLQTAQPQLVCEQLRHVCDWLLYFLTLLGVHKDSGLAIGVFHEQLPRHLRDKFPVQSLKAGRSADTCKIANIVRNRWYRLAENREIQVVRPWYELL